MKIALLHDFLGRSRGGIEAWNYHVAEALIALGHVPQAITQDPAAVPADAMPPGVEVTVLKTERRLRVPVLGRWKQARAYSRQIAAHCTDVDAFWCSSYMTALVAHGAAAGRAVLYIQVTPYPVYRRLYEKNFPPPPVFLGKLRFWCRMKEAGFLEKRAMKGTTGLVYVSKSRQEEILEYYGQGFRPKCHVVPPGVDINRFRPGDRAWTGEGPLRTVTVCRLSVEKNIQCLIRAVALLKKRGLRTESVIVGEGPLRSQLEQLASDEGVTDRVSFAGGRGDVDLFYRQADVFVLPSINEGFALAYLEAFASGLPAIAIRNCPGRILVAADEIIDHKRTGLLIDDDSPELLAEALLEVYQNPDRRSEWGRNARETCEKKFTWEQAVGRMLAISQNR